MGKTVFTKWILSHLKRYIVLDTTWQFSSGYIIHYPKRLQESFKKWNRIIYKPIKYQDSYFHQFFTNCLQICNYTLIIDEVDRFAHARGYISPSLREIINRGRVQGIGIICNSRRPALTHKDLRGNADYVICFNLHLQDDLKYMAKWMGCTPQTIKALPPYHSIIYNANTTKITKFKPCPLT